LGSNPLLTFFYNIDPKTGEVRTTNRDGKKITPHQTAYYRGIKFVIFDTGLVTIEGSFHKYWNGGEHNYNDFNLTSLKVVLKEFLNSFEISPSDAIINQLEVGLNISTPYPANKILQHIFLHKTKEFLKCYTKTEGNYYQTEHQHYYIKIYNKSLQYKKHYKVEKDLLRVEIKYKRPRLKKIGVNTLEDLINISFEVFNKDLVFEFENLLFYDFTIKHNSTRLFNYSNPIYWKDYLLNNQKSTFYKHKKILKEYTLKYSNNVQRQLIKIIEKKAIELTLGGASINSICIEVIPTPPQERKCKITGLGISMQRRDSFLLSHRGLRYYKKHNYNVFKEVERVYLSDYWKNSKDEVKIKEIAHNIRNKYYNRKVDSNQLKLII